MREVESQGRRGIQWTITSQLHDLDYADDICLLFQKMQYMQTKTGHLALAAEQTGLRIIKEKTKVMRSRSERCATGGRPQLYVFRDYRHIRRRSRRRCKKQDR